MAAVYLIAIEPAWRAWQLDAALPRLVMFGAPFVALAIAHVLVAGVAVAAGRAFLRTESTAAAFGRVWAASAVVLAIVTWLTPYFPVTRPASERRIALGLAIGWFLAWYVACSRLDRPRFPGAETSGTNEE